MPYIIDGHNLLRAVQKSFESCQNLSQLQMCRLIDVFIYKMCSKCDLVFDGTGPPDISDFQKLENIKVHFSGSQKEADDIIEILISKNTAPKRLNVISDDRRLIAAAKKRKSNPLPCLNFWIFLTERLNKKKQVKEPHAKQAGISDSETDDWLREFGF